MKKIQVKRSPFADYVMGNNVYTFFITFPTNPGYAYTMTATEEGWMYITKLWEEAGYEVVETRPWKSN